VRLFACRFGLFDVRRADFRTVDLRFVAIFRMRKIAKDERAKVVSGVALSTILKTRRAALFRGQKPSQPLGCPETRTKRSSRLSWRSFVVRQNFSNCRRKVIDAGTRHDDAVATAMSFFGDAQEFPALVFSELHVEMLAFYLQFSRLDDVIHFPLKPQTLPHPIWGMEEKSAEFVQILWVRRLGPLWLPNPALTRLDLRWQISQRH
jgi:hypothetical protein